MTAEALGNAVRGRFKTEVEDTLSITVQYDNVKTDPPPSGTWVRFFMHETEARQADFGASTKRFRTVGEALAMVMSPLDLGDKAAREVADTVVAAFRALSVSGVVFRTPSVLPIGRSDDNLWWQVNVSCPFYYDEIA